MKIGGRTSIDAVDPDRWPGRSTLDPNRVDTILYCGVGFRTHIIVWQDWSQFGEPSLEVTSTTTRSATVNLNYDDTWGFALGGRYKFTPDWQWSLGIAFDTSPMSKSQRTPALPLDQQIRVGTGVQYAINERATVGTAYQYLNLGDADLDRNRGPLAGHIQGNYSTNEIHWFNVTFSWKF